MLSIVKRRNSSVLQFDSYLRLNTSNKYNMILGNSFPRTLEVLRIRERGKEDTIETLELIKN